MHGHTPAERIEAAVRDELVDLSRRAEEALSSLSAEGEVGAVLRSRELLRSTREQPRFPREELAELARQSPARVATEIERWIDKHRELERRLRWLLDPSLTRAELTRLDPREDAERIWCFVQYEFRPEFLYSAWGNAMKRIVQMESATILLHATGRSETMPITRADETLCFFHYFFEWGKDSYHGRKAIESVNRMHGRYAIPDGAMKFVLLNSAFTVLDSLDRVGHRPLREIERLGYFHAFIEMGLAMGIQGLSHSWEEMLGWFRERCRAWSNYSPRKLRMWTSIHDKFDRDLGLPPPLARLRRLPEVYGMDATYRSALGFAPREDWELALFRRLMRVVARARRSLPVEPWILSLQNFYSFPNGARIEDLGPKERSPRLPPVSPGSAERLPVLDWSEIKKHDREDDLWVVFGGYVYDVSSFARNHPGGARVFLDGVGRDLTQAFEAAGHDELTRVFVKNFRIGRLATSADQAGSPARSGAADGERVGASGGE